MAGDAAPALLVKRVLAGGFMTSCRYLVLLLFVAGIGVAAGRGLRWAVQAAPRTAQAPPGPSALQGCLREDGKDGEGFSTVEYLRFGD